MIKKIISMLLAAVFSLQLAPMVALAADDGTVSVANGYLEVIVNRENGGYVIKTVAGDILKQSDDYQSLLHRGQSFDSSFTSFQIDGDTGQEYIFGNAYGFLGMGAAPVATEADGRSVTSVWSVGEMTFTQRIELVNNAASEQLGTAQILYTVQNNSAAARSVKSRLLTDTQLGGQDYGIYEVSAGILGGGFDTITAEKTLDAAAGDYIPSDYFAKDSGFAPQVAAFGVNSVLATEKPYRMTFAHWQNLAATIFDYTADGTLTFTNHLNSHATADSAVALYYDLGSIPAGGSRTFSTYYGVTANVKNRDNQILLNTTAPARLDFNPARTAFIGSSGAADNRIRISTLVTNPSLTGRTYSRLEVVIYAMGFSTQRQNDLGEWTAYDNTVPIFTEIHGFSPGKSIETFFDFRFQPRDSHELGSFVTKVYNMDPAVNPRGDYAEDYCLGTTSNSIFIPARDPNLPTITLLSAEPKLLYNDLGRYVTVAGKGMTFFAASQFQGVELRGGDKTYSFPAGALTVAEDGNSASLYIDRYMEPGQYQIHFLWETPTPQPDIPADMTAPAMTVSMTDDESYRNDKYGVVTVERAGKTAKEYSVRAFKDETAFKKAEIPMDNLLLTMRGDLVRDNDKNTYRMAGRDRNITINSALNYYGGSFAVEESGGTVKVSMNGKLTTIGANTTVRNGSAALHLEKGTQYVIPHYDHRGAELDNGVAPGAGQSFLELKWDNAMDVLQTIGGFLIDLRYGLFGKLKDTDGRYYDIISFGGGLDMAFMTPGGAKTARENKNKNDSWSFSVLDNTSGLNPIGEKIVAEGEPETKAVTRLGVGADVHDVLYGSNKSKTGYLGINMEADIVLPQIVSFLPSKMTGSIAINTIGGYQVGVEGMGKAMSFEMQFALVIKSNPGGAPIPDKLYFTLGGFEPGINVDPFGIFWLTGGGGGFDKLYDTIYKTDGLPPLTLLLNVQFDIIKILTGSADLELSLRSIGITLSDVSLKVIKNARFLESGYVGVTWYPNVEVALRANVNFLGLFRGSFYVIGVEDLFEMMLRVAISLPKVIPVIGGMEIASAELGGGTVKMWGAVKVLDLINLGFTYYWDSGDVEFTTGRSGARAAYDLMTAPVEIGRDEESGQTEYLQMGTNLSYLYGSGADSTLTREEAAQFKQGGAPALAAGIRSTTDLTTHALGLLPGSDYIVTVSRADGEALGDGFEDEIRLYRGGEAYPLSFYEKTGDLAADRQSTQSSNVNVVGKVAYIGIPEREVNGSPFLLELGGAMAYHVGVSRVEPIPALTNVSARVTGGALQVSWDGENLPPDARVRISLSEEKGAAGIPLDGRFPVQDKVAAAALDNAIASGSYYVNVTVSSEDKYYVTSTSEEPVTVINAAAPAKPGSVAVDNIGNNKLSVKIEDDFSKANLEGYFLEVYEDGALKEAGLYYDKEAAQRGGIIIGGVYEMPVFETVTVPVQTGDGAFEDSVQIALDGGGNPVPAYEDDGVTPKTRTVGYQPGSEYQVFVRAGKTAKDGEGEVLYCSEKVESAKVILREAVLPRVRLTLKDRDGMTSGSAENTVVITSDIPVRGTLTVNGAAGESYDFDELSTSFEKSLALEDGVHTLEWTCQTREGDKAMETASFSVDTQPPAVMLESPVDGGVYADNRIVLRGAAESDARYTFAVDATVIGEAGRDMSAFIREGILEYALELGSGPLRRVLTVSAEDPAGNRTENTYTLTDSGIGRIRRVEIYQDGAPVPDGRIALSDERPSAQLHLMGILSGGQVIDITGMEGASFGVVSGSSVTVTDDGQVAGAGIGESQVVACLTLQEGAALYDGISVSAQSVAHIPAPIPEPSPSPARPGGAGRTTAAVPAALSLMNRKWEKASASMHYEQLMEQIGKAGFAVLKTGNGSAVLTRENVEGMGLGQNDSLTLTMYLSEGEGEVCYKPELRKGTAELLNPGVVKYRLPYTSENGVAEQIGEDYTAGVIVQSAYFSEGYTLLYDNPFVLRIFEYQPDFADVAEGFWARQDIGFAAGRGLMKGVSETEFDPEGLVTRAMAVTILHRLAGAPLAEGNPFGDVARGQWYFDAVAWAAEKGIVTGVSAEAFQPDAFLTREQLAAVLYRYAGAAGMQTTQRGELSAFADGEAVSGYAADAVSWSAAGGLISGRTQTTLAPQGNATRAELAAVLQRFVKNSIR